MRMPLVDNTPPPRTGRGTLMVVVGAFVLLACAMAIAAGRLGEPEPAPGAGGVATEDAGTTSTSATSPPARVPTAGNPGDPDAPSAHASVVAEIEGLVRSRDGRPVVGAMVVLLEAAAAAPQHALGYEAIERARSACMPTDGAGRFRLPRCAPDSPARVAATADGYAGAMVIIAAGARGDVVLELAPGRTLRGRVSAPDGDGVADGVV